MGDKVKEKDEGGKLVVKTRLNSRKIVGNPRLEKELDNAIAFIKSKGFHFIKFELEAVFTRGVWQGCKECGWHGSNTKPERCNKCDGFGNLDLVDGKLKKCSACASKAKPLCSKGHFRFSNINDCDKYIKNTLSKETRKALTYINCYVDGSVDTELTFTLPITEVRRVIEVINVFTSMQDYVGVPMSIRGAGMHTAILNSRAGTYPIGNNLNSTKLSNFTQQMNKLMPALFLLASSDTRSRHCHYRRPGVGGGKSYAINRTAGGYPVLEYRVFETAYAYPERIYQNVGVIARSLEYYDTKIILPNSIMKRTFTHQTPLGSTVRRFFATKSSYEQLELTLPYLLPAGYSDRRMKQERGVEIDMASFERRENKRTEEGKLLWKEHLERMAAFERDLKKRIDQEWDDMPKRDKSRWTTYGISNKLKYRQKRLSESVRSDVPKDMKSFMAAHLNETRGETRSELGSITL